MGNRVLVIGAFGYNNNQLDGQTVKTRSVYKLLKNKHGGAVNMIDTLDRKSPYFLVKLFFKIVKCNTLIIIPAENGLAVLLPLLYILSKILNYSVVCVCVGGWQIEYFKGQYTGRSHYISMGICKRIKAFLPEMESVNTKLVNDYGFSNTTVFPNFRVFNIASDKNNSKGLKIVFMARIQKMKGYVSLFELADYIQQLNIDASITFYGQISEEDKIDFLSKVEEHKVIVSYKGALTPDVIQDTLSQYDVLILPTKYYTEGFPGSILDAYIAGIPVIVTEWKHAHEFVEDGETGFIVPFDDGQEELNARVKELYENRVMLSEMKEKAKKKSMNYSADAAWNILNKYL